MLFLLNTGKHSSSFLYATSDIGKDVDDVMQMQTEYKAIYV